MHILSMTCSELAAALHEGWGGGMVQAAAVYRHVLRQGRTDIAAAPGLRHGLGRELQAACDSTAPAVAGIVEGGDAAKIVFTLADGLRVEAVHMPMPGRSTLCISCQAGCRMGCAFCRTGSSGLQRHLRAEEITGQVFAVRHGLGRAVDNVVFMGMGEPLDNFDNVAQAIRVLSDQRGLDIAHSRITLSTAGLPDGIRRLGRLSWPRLNLAVSLNAANDALRSQLMPVNRSYPLASLRQALQEYPLRKKGVFLIEYLLLKGVNDGREQADDLAGFVAGLAVRVNVLGYNPVSGRPFESPGAEGVRRFCARLADRGVFVRMRSPRGLGACAACGQLGGA